MKQRLITIPDGADVPITIADDHVSVPFALSGEVPEYIPLSDLTQPQRDKITSLRLALVELAHQRRGNTEV